MVWIRVWPRGIRYTVKKGYRFSRPQPGCHLPNFPWPGTFFFIPGRATESLVKLNKIEEKSTFVNFSFQSYTKPLGRAPIRSLKRSVIFPHFRVRGAWCGTVDTSLA
jgi:hypothetical protein